MRTLILTFALLLPGLALAQPTCPEQAPSIVGVGSSVQICLDEAVDGIDAEVDGTVVRIPGPFAMGVHPERITIEACAVSTLRGRSYNEAGEGEWGPTVAATFRPCSAPVLLP